MEWGVLFMGPVGSGKSNAIKSLSDIDVLQTDVNATDETSKIKKTTTVGMDVGGIHLGDGDKLRLYGSPGQDRFDFMWEILLEQVKGVIILLNHASEDPLQELQHYIDNLARALHGKSLPLVIGVTHRDLAPEKPLTIYLDYLQVHPIAFAPGTTLVCPLDARKKGDVLKLMIAMAGILETKARLTVD